MGLFAGLGRFARVSQFDIFYLHIPPLRKRWTAIRTFISEIFHHEKMLVRPVAVNGSRSNQLDDHSAIGKRIRTRAQKEKTVEIPFIDISFELHGGCIPLVWRRINLKLYWRVVMDDEIPDFPSIAVNNQNAARWF